MGVDVSSSREEGGEGWVLRNGKVQKSTSCLASLLQAVYSKWLMRLKLLTESETVSGDR